MSSTRVLQNSVSSPRRDHPAEVLTVGLWSALIDSELVPLMEALWTLGIETHNSCQNINESGRVFLGFVSVAEGEKFLACLTMSPGLDPGFLHRILGRVAGVFRARHAADDAYWEHRFWTNSVAMGTAPTSGQAAGRPFMYGVSYTFPRQDLAEVTLRMRRAAGLDVALS